MHGRVADRGVVPMMPTKETNSCRRKGPDKKGLGDGKTGPDAEPERPVRQTDPSA